MALKNRICRYVLGLLSSGYTEGPKLDYILVIIENKHSSMASGVEMSYLCRYQSIIKKYVDCFI